MSTERRRGFTLIEMLIVIAIIGVLGALLLPALHGVRERVKRLTCQNNLRQLAQAMRTYGLLYKDFPPIGYTPLWAEKDYPMEVLSIAMGWMDKPLKDGGLPPKVILCPSCGINRDPKWRTSAMWGGQVPWNAPMRHYAMSGHCDTTSERHLMDVAAACLGDGTDPSPWPHISGGTAYFQVLKMAHVTHPSTLAIFADSNEGSDLGGSGSGHSYDWKMSSHRNRVNERVPTRHNNGGNIVFLDGHVEWKSKEYLLKPSNQDDWLLGSHLSDRGLWVQR